jgi:hypothetical protein
MHQFMSDQSAVNRAIFKHDAMPESDPACFVSYQLCLFYCIRLTNRTCHFAAEFAEVGG